MGTEIVQVGYTMYAVIFQEWLPIYCDTYGLCKVLLPTKSCLAVSQSGAALTPL